MTGEVEARLDRKLDDVVADSDRLAERLGRIESLLEANALPGGCVERAAGRDSEAHGTVSAIEACEGAPKAASGRSNRRSRT